MTIPGPFEYDDLTAIKGIGPARQQWLRDTFAVMSYADLAALSVDTIHERLKEGQIASTGVIESWIRQAKALAAVPLPRHIPAAGSPEWKPVASFVVEFQQHEASGSLRTSVHHVEADRTQQWQGVQQTELCRWMAMQLGDYVPADEGDESAPAAIGYSEKLQRLLVKIGNAAPPLPVPARPVSPQPAAEISSGGFSDRLQELIARTTQLSAGKQK